MSCIAHDSNRSNSLLKTCWLKCFSTFFKTGRSSDCHVQAVKSTRYSQQNELVKSGEAHQHTSTGLSTGLTTQDFEKSSRSAINIQTVGCCFKVLPIKCAEIGFFGMWFSKSIHKRKCRPISNWWLGQCIRSSGLICQVPIYLDPFRIIFI